MKRLKVYALLLFIIAAMVLSGFCSTDKGSANPVTISRLFQIEGKVYKDSCGVTVSND